MENFIIVGVIAVIVILAFVYIYKSKKSGKKCIGCPDACNCSKKNCK
ncbi:MAG: FeoB-associated Cys-rich membrane protein [Clostridia bacterium]|nr:FeoB-associated Cys-rich membrane protein [Clostridia bacterium]